LQSSKITLLHIDGDYPNSALTLMIKDEDRSKFSYTQEEFLKDKKILINGKIIGYKEKPEIIVTEQMQIKVLQ